MQLVQQPPGTFEANVSSINLARAMRASRRESKTSLLSAIKPVIPIRMAFSRRETEQLAGRCSPESAGVLCADARIWIRVSRNTLELSLGLICAIFTPSRVDVARWSSKIERSSASSSRFEAMIGNDRGPRRALKAEKQTRVVRTKSVSN